MCHSHSACVALPKLSMSSDVLLSPLVSNNFELKNWYPDVLHHLWMFAALSQTSAACPAQTRRGRGKQRQLLFHAGPAPSPE
mmetsp:Transcript_50329/g.94014  ORF Transcript_50329/g.94014 Transcript_50329/m.94014 type:complete len:82 (+) Transcript_50329:37-282(+)